ncbi:hypothetical protein [Myxococcus sp. RHSTA-1-4]|uniref:hypothetical protein n=1 Tax=Myxococcus sp. RHSTA-1-4 TaxID=2874601 RepID=UPI001CBD8CB9|nr:hypothetical protein [Myxococcus sp. RHSTA-1-4]MBZ4422008.1 hypothetical protein [Myxococcus sp. RHSTA-1-4]
MALHAVTQEVRQALAAAESRAFLRRGPGFARRAEAIEFLDTHVLDRLEFLGENTSLPEDLRVLVAQAQGLRQRLETANGRVIRRLREQVAAGRYTPEALRSTMIRHAGPPGSPGSYDGLDLMMGGLLGGSAPAEPSVEREPEMVGYQPTPARAILDLVERAEIRRDDVFCDLGSGLGQVVILVALLSGARGWGVELEPAYCEYARLSAGRLEVPGVEFIQADARVGPLAGGNGVLPVHAVPPGAAAAGPGAVGSGGEVSAEPGLHVGAMYGRGRRNALAGAGGRARAPRAPGGRFPEPLRPRRGQRRRPLEAQEPGPKTTPKSPEV